MSVLSEDLALGDALSQPRLAAATRHLRVSTVRLWPGPWEQPVWAENIRRGLGLLVLDGLLLRRMRFHQRAAGELVGPGDLTRPWESTDLIGVVPYRSEWEALEPCRLAVLDLSFAHRLRSFPELSGAIVSRALRRTRQLAVLLAIVQQPKVEDRLHMLLWHLAGRWGTVDDDGAVVSLPLTHAKLADIVAARRPTVSAALSSLEEANLITATETGWALHGTPDLAFIPAAA